MGLKQMLTLLAVACWQLVQGVTTSRTPNMMLCSDEVRATLVEKKVDVKYQYALSSQNVWTQFPDMNIEFDLERDQRVALKYKISFVCSGQDQFMTRLLIDGKENTDFRVASGNTWFHTNIGDELVWMTKGRHYARVQYRTPRGRTISYWDWTVAYFKISYFQLE